MMSPPMNEKNGYEYSLMLRYNQLPGSMSSLEAIYLCNK